MFDAGGLSCVLTFVRDYGSVIHKDTLYSAMTVVTRLCGRMEPNDPMLDNCVESFSSLLRHSDKSVS